MIATPERLIIFARYLEIGKVKTRLIPDLGAEAATDIYRQLAEFTLKQARTLRLIRNIDIEVWFTGGTKAEMQAWLGDDLNYQMQAGETLGDRLIYAIQTAIDHGSKGAIVIGTDCPELDATILNQGFTQLQDRDLVLGAATDGGYYLIGLRQCVPQLFINIPWSTSAVFAQTIDIAKTLGMSQFLLPTLSDVDTAQDLGVWQQVKTKYEVSKPRISIIIPTLNEAENLPLVLETLSYAKDIEVIIVDGGSSDQTVAIAQTQTKVSELKLITGASGRAKQMNLGASEARGEILLFLHGDTVLPPNFDLEICSILAKPATVAGAFKLKIAGKGWGLRLVEWGVNRRSQLWQMPYGDQAIFINTARFQKLGGFANLAIMEDFEIMLRLKKQGRITISPLTVTTSGRRWQKLGIFSTTLINQIMILGYLWGVKPAKLAQWYRQWQSKN